MTNLPANIENQLDRLEGRMDLLSIKIDAHQYSNLQLIHTIDKKVESHSSIFILAKWIVPSGGLLALVSCLLTFFKH